MTAEAASEEDWEVGPSQDYEVTFPEPESDPLVRSISLNPGGPTYRTSNGLEWIVEGDFTLALWGAKITVVDEHGNQEDFQSGRWTQNQTPATAERREQLLELHATNASLRLDLNQGHAQWTGPKAVSQTHGTVTYKKAEGFFDSELFAYEARDHDVRLVGTITQTVDTDGSDRLTAWIDTEDTQINLEPTSQIAHPENGVATWWWIGAMASLLVIVVLGSGTIAARRGFWDWGHQAYLASRDMERERFGRAKWRANRVIRHRPDSAEAWAVYGSIGIVQGRSRRVVEDLENVVNEVDQPSLVALVVTLGHLQFGDEEKAKKWFKIASTEKGFAKEVAKIPALWELKQKFGLIADSDDIDSGYA